MFVVHPDTKFLHELTFQVTSHEGSVIVSCATSLELGLIHLQKNLDEFPEECSLIYNTVDMPKKKKNKNCQAQSIRRPKKPKNVMWSVTKEENTDVQLSKPARLCRDKNFQSTRCYRSPRRPIQSK